MAGEDPNVRMWRRTQWTGHRGGGGSERKDVEEDAVDRTSWQMRIRA